MELVVRGTQGPADRAPAPGDGEAVGEPTGVGKGPLLSKGRASGGEESLEGIRHSCHGQASMPGRPKVFFPVFTNRPRPTFLSSAETRDSRMMVTPYASLICSIRS